MFGFRSPEFRRWLVLCGVVTSLSACAYLPQGTGEPNRGYIELMDAAATADRAGLAGMQERARARHAGSATVENRLRLALLLSAPGARYEDIRRSVDLLAPLADGSTTAAVTQRQLARARLAEVRNRLSLLSDNAEKTRQLDSLKAQLDDANAKIDELLDIEQSMESGRRRDSGEDYTQ